MTKKSAQKASTKTSKPPKPSSFPPYDYQAIEKKWADKWFKDKLYQAPEKVDPKKKLYILPQLPYPSGSGLHVGHASIYIACDAYARYQRMIGKHVLQVIGWDAFGLPAENYAVKTNVHPKITINKAIDNFRYQLRRMGESLDWSREVGSHNPDYYKWTQWFFLLMYKRGLAYRKKQAVNWCDSCKTTLANEQVVDGHCERCETEVIQKDMEQWFLKITEYADRLDRDLDKVDWPAETVRGQRYWIGRKEGAEIEFRIQNSESRIKVFTTRPDTLHGATFMVLAPEHRLFKDLKSQIQNIKEVEAYVNQAKRKTELERKEGEKEKTGVKIEGLLAINPVNNQEIPIFVADYVLMEYGEGAVMGVPAHDQRDFEFAKAYHLSVKTVIEPITGETHENEEFRRSIVAIVRNPKTNKFLSINWGEKLGGNLFIGGGIEEDEDLVKTSAREVKEETGYQHLKFVNKSEKVHHHYFAASKNVHREIEAVGLLFELANEEKVEPQLEKDEQGKFQVEWLSEEQALEKVKDPLHEYVFNKLVRGIVHTGAGVLTNSGDWNGWQYPEDLNKVLDWLEKKGIGSRKTTYRLRDWLISRQRFWGAPIPIVYDPEGNPHPVDESDLPVLLPDDVDFRPTGQSPLTYSKDFQKGVEKKYGKGWRREVDTMDTFMCSSWYYYRYIDPKNDQEFASKKALKTWMPVDFYLGGPEYTYSHLLYSRFFTKVLHDAGLIDFNEPFLVHRHQGLILGEDHRKMSKRWNNVINPTDVMNRHGADTLRLYEMFMGPLSESKAWNTRGEAGIYRFINKIWRLFHDPLKIKSSPSSPVSPSDSGQARMTPKVSNPKLVIKLHQTIKKVGQDIQNLKFNTAIAAMMEFVNLWREEGERLSKDDAQKFLLILAPFAPFLTEELWSSFAKATEDKQQLSETSVKSAHISSHQQLDKSDKSDLKSPVQKHLGGGKSLKNSNLQFSSKVKSGKISIHQHSWPEFAKELIIEEQVEIPVQINGKLRATLSVKNPESRIQETVEKFALENEGVTRHLTNKKVLKIVFVPGKLINFVVK